MRVSLVQNFLTGIADAGRELWDRRRSDDDDGIRGIRELCFNLLSQKGEALGTALARELIRAYETLDEDARRAFSHNPHNPTSNATRLSSQRSVSILARRACEFAITRQC